MKVVNYNNNVRKEINKMISELNKKDSYQEEKYINLFIDLYNETKQGTNYTDYLLGLIFETAYLVNSLSLSRYPDDKELKSNLKYLKGFSSIDDLKNRLTPNSFVYLLEDFNYFCDSDLYYKRQSVINALDDKEYLMHIFPGFLIDVFSYLNRYDSSIIEDGYYERVKANDSNAFDNTVNMAVEDLIYLEEEDFDSYKYIILEVIESYYKYKKYLLSNNSTIDEFDEKIILMIEEDLQKTLYFSINNIVFLEKIISGYLEYKILSFEQTKKIDEYYDNKDNNKNFIKIIKKSNNLKNQKNR